MIRWKRVAGTTWVREDGSLYTCPYPIDRSGERNNGKGAAQAIRSELRSYWRRQWDDGYPMPDGRVRPEGPQGVSIRESKTARIREQAEKDRLLNLPVGHCRNWARGWCQFENHCKYIHAQKGVSDDFGDSPIASSESSSEGGEAQPNPARGWCQSDRGTQRRRRQRMRVTPCPELAKGRCSRGDKCKYFHGSRPSVSMLYVPENQL